jgi:hypothetical protein
MSNDELKYKKLRESLRSLPRLKAKGDFEARLYRKIREQESHSGLHTAPEYGRKSSLIDILANLLRPSLVPAVGLTVVLLVAIVVYFAYFNELNKDTQQVTEDMSVEKKGEFVIYVRKDGERVYDESARDIVSAEEKQPSTLLSPTDVSTDAFSKPVEPLKTETEVRDKLDRLSDEQKIEMEKGHEPKKELDESKSIPKTEEHRVMKKGFEKDSKEAPSNIRNEEVEDTGSKNADEIIEQKSNEPYEMNQQIEGKSVDDEKNRIVRSRKDSLKAKDKKVEEQKDSMEK